MLLITLRGFGTLVVALNSPTYYRKTRQNGELTIIHKSKANYDEWPEDLIKNH